MSKEQTRITELQELMNVHLSNRGFSKEYLLNNRGLIGAVIEEMESRVNAKVLEALENKKECLHDWVDGSLGTEWIIECSKCERDLFDVYNQEDAVKILRNRSKTKL